MATHDGMCFWNISQLKANFQPDFIEEIIKASSMSHNFVQVRNGIIYEDTEILTLVDIDELSKATWRRIRSS